MKNGHLMLRASIVAALAAVPALSFAARPNANALAGINTAESPRVAQTIDARVVSTLVHTHPSSLSRATPKALVNNAMQMDHLQLVLQPSALRRAQLESLIEQQHDPKSPRFHQWITPGQYGKTFGVLDSDVNAVASWLKSQGLTVNGVYPNNRTIDFSGKVSVVNQAFHTQEQHFQIDGADYIANATDISVPKALQPVIIGVMGLSNYGAKPMAQPARTGKWNAKTHRFDLPVTSTSTAKSQVPVPQAVQTSGVRGLVPDDFATMYGVSTIRGNGVTGQGITIALVETGIMSATGWNNFVSQFNLGSYGGTFTYEQPELNDSTLNNCIKPYSLIFGADDDIESAIDVESATAIAPGATIIDAACANVWVEDPPAGLPPIPNIYEGMYIAANNLVNSITIGEFGEEYAGPDILSASFGFSESETTDVDKAEVDALWAQADAEGTSVFVSSGDWGPVTNGVGLDVNSLATSPHVTAVGGTDLVDVLDGTTSRFFSPTPNAVYGTALGYVPEIPWNESCANGVAAKAAGYASAPAYCAFLLSVDPQGYYLSFTASTGGASTVDIKPSWQKQVFNTAADGVRDVPDVALFAGSNDGNTAEIICTKNFRCTPGFTGEVNLTEGTSVSSPLFAGIQALIDQGLVMRGMPKDQGNAAPALYAIAAGEYGVRNGTAPASLAACSADNSTAANNSCVFHNITRGTNSTECFQETSQSVLTPNCFFFGEAAGVAQIGMTSLDPTQYGPQSKAYSAQPGWSFASGLGSVNARNLLIAWRALVNAPPAPPQAP
ncbi:protease pro-enzyme activation domain-containing protein [Rhodanobacter sp. L36]|uniref:S53 family peptidase n=1 Tax=Rhodanobacter sp. L36 TaxID=1747221 RepID=UPI00131C495D|nr:protease pro-enzyme activation domain-containing protein [Rhodanobacter sp. L36]